MSFLRISARYASIAGAFLIIATQLSHPLMHDNPFFAAATTALLPLLILARAGDVVRNYTDLAQTWRSAIIAGCVTGILFVILVSLANTLALPYNPPTNDIWGHWLFKDYISGLILWPVISSIAGIGTFAFTDRLPEQWRARWRSF